jgi:putative redox protein
MTETKGTVLDGGNGFFIGISHGGHSLVMETNGERASAVTPIELLLIAVGGCMGSDVAEILRKKREYVTDYRIEISGDRRAEFPRSFHRIRLHHVVRGRNLSEAAVRQAVDLANLKYCSVAATLRPAAEVSVTFALVPEEHALQPTDTR